MELKNQFSKYAKEYKSYNIIQQICAKSLVRELKSKPKNILELGCGSGQIFSNVDWEFDKYLAIDGSKQMCELHPKAKNLIGSFRFNLSYTSFLINNVLIIGSL